MLALLLACQDPDPAPPPAEGSSLPDIRQGGCDATAAAWLPTEDMGQLVAVEPLPTMSFTAETLSALLEAQGYATFSPVPFGVTTWRVRYTSQDRGQPIEATALVTLPELAQTADLPIVLWLHPTAGFTDACAPSARGVEGAVFPVLWASLGYAVVAPDYLGLNGFGESAGLLHPFLSAEPTAVVSLDALRALVNLADEAATPARPDPDRVISWGASEGGFAALWTDRYLPHYAPEFRALATVAAVPVTDPLAVATHGMNEFGPTSRALAAALTTESAWYRSSVPLTDILKAPVAASLPGELAASCDSFPSLDDAAEVSDLFPSAFAAEVAAGNWAAVGSPGCWLSQSVLRTSDIEFEAIVPTLIVTGEDDDLAWPEPVRTDIPALCDQGYDIQHVECAGADHTEAAVQSLPLTVEWLAGVVAGERPSIGSSCAAAAPSVCGP